MRRAALVAVVAALGAAPASAVAATAPGRVVYPVANLVPFPGFEALGAVGSIALPDGGVVALADQELTLVRLRADGSLDPSFGTGGIARLAVPGGAFVSIQLLRRPDGRLVVVGVGAQREDSEVPRLLVAGLSADGAPDPAFGAGGFVALDIESSCGAAPCHLAALAPDGGIVLTGAIGQLRPEQRGLGEKERSEWVVRRLTPDGAVDTAFGLVKIPGPSGGGGAAGGTVVVRPTGEIVVLGEHDETESLVGLTASGERDRGFAGGALVKVASEFVTDALLHAGGAIDVVTATKILRYTTAGSLDRSYNTGGSVDIGRVDTGDNLPRLLAGPGDATTLWWVPLYAPAPTGTPRAGVLPLSPAGRLGTPRRLAPAFGGGRSSDPGETTGSILQNSFAGDLLLRPDGSYVVVGGVRIARQTVSGRGASSGYLAAAAFTSALAPDLAFGGPAARPAASASLASQTARFAASRRAVRTTLTASSPGLLRVRVTDAARGRLLARGVQSLFAAGTTTARVPLTKVGRRALRRARNLRVRVSWDFRDLLAGRARGSGRAILR